MCRIVCTCAYICTKTNKYTVSARVGHCVYTCTQFIIVIQPESVNIKRSIVLALAACYLVRLADENRRLFMNKIRDALTKLVDCDGLSGPDFMEQQLEL